MGVSVFSVLVITSHIKQVSVVLKGSCNFADGGGASVRASNIGIYSAQNLDCEYAIVFKY